MEYLCGFTYQIPNTLSNIHFSLNSVRNKLNTRILEVIHTNTRNYMQRIYNKNPSIYTLKLLQSEAYDFSKMQAMMVEMSMTLLLCPSGHYFCR